MVPREENTMTFAKKMLTSGRVLFLLFCLLLGLFAIYPQPWEDGVSIKGITKNSSAELGGMAPPKAKTAPVQLEIIHAINNKQVATLADYYALTSTLEPNQTVRVKTDKNTYTLTTRPKYNVTLTNRTSVTYVNETYEVNETVNETTTLVNKTRSIRVEEPVVLRELIGIEPLGISVAEAPTSNLRKGLDLSGGTRVVLKPEGNTSAEVVTDAVETLKERLNVYGLSDVLVTEVSTRPDVLGGGDKYILVEIAGATETEVRELLGSQGKFEAKIANKTVFSGGNDITYVCRTATCSGLDPNYGCQGSGNNYACRFMFSITLSPDSAQRQADATAPLNVVADSLSEQIVLYLDDVEVDRLGISPDLRGRAVTDIAITGGQSGTTYEQALDATLSSMKRLQTVLKTGSLPVKLTIERVDTISPTLGSGFLKNAFTVGLLSLLVVSIIIYAAYRRLAVAIPIMFTALCEIFLTLALASVIGWNIDLAAIAGIILAVGTGVNDQIIITDETLAGDKGGQRSWKERVKRAFGIIMSSYFTMSVAMLPLFFAGAGLLKGFALTTILAVSIGVFITRPAYSAIVQKLVEE